MCDTQSSPCPLLPAGCISVYLLLLIGHRFEVIYLLLSCIYLFVFLSFFLCPSPSSTGFGGCVDLIVDGVSLLNKIGLAPTDQPHHHDYIENEVQLAQSFAYFFAPGAAAE